MSSGLFLSCLELSCFHSVHTPCPDVGPLAWHVTILRTWNDVSSQPDGVVTHTPEALVLNLERAGILYGLVEA